MNLRQIEAFKTLMGAGSMTAAAKILNSTQPTISKLITQLEREMKLRLFDRAHGRLLPRPEAHTLLRDVEKALGALEQVGRSAQQLSRSHAGLLRIASIPSVGTGLIPRAIATFIKTRPRVTVALYVRSSTYVRERVSGELADCGFVSEGPILGGAVSKPFHETPGAICMLPARHPLRKKAVIRPEDLAGERFISVGRDTTFRHLIDQAFTDRNIEERLVIQTNSVATACALVAEGAGVGVFDPFSAMAYFDRKYLRLRPFAPDVPFRVNSIVLASPLSLIVSDFLDHLAEERILMVKALRALIDID